MCPTRSNSGQHLVQGMVHRRLLIRVERVDGVHQNLERIMRKCFCPYSSVALDGLQCGATGGRLKLGLHKSSLSFPKISSVQIRAMRQNQRIIRRDGFDPSSAGDVCR